MPNQPTKTLWPTVTVAIFAGIVVALHLGKVAPSLPTIGAEFGGDLATIGWIASIVALVGALLSVVLGTVATYVDPRRLAIAALLLIAIASAAGAVAQSATALIVSRIFEGVAIITVAVTAPDIVARASTASHRSYALALWSTYVPTGMTVGILIAVAILSVGDWRIVWLTIAAITLVFCFIFAFLTRPMARAHAPVQRSFQWSGLHASLATPGPWYLGACFFCYALMWVTLITWMPSFLFNELSLSLTGAGLATALMTGANVIGNFAGALWLRADRSRSRLILIAMLVMSVSGWLTLRSGAPTELRIVMGIGFSMVSGVIPAALFSASSTLARRPSDVASANGVIVQSSQLGQLIGPPMAGAVAQAGGGFGAVALIFPFASGIGMVFAVAVARLEARRSKEASASLSTARRLTRSG